MMVMMVVNLRWQFPKSAPSPVSEASAGEGEGGEVDGDYFLINLSAVALKLA